LNTRSEIVITIRRGDWTFEVKNTVEDEDLPLHHELATLLTDMASSVSSHLVSIDPGAPRQPF